MKALVLSGGSGTRLRPPPAPSAERFHHSADKPALLHVIEGVADAGITDVGIVLGDTADEVRAAVGDGARFGVSITYLPQHRPPGLAHAVRTARHWLGDDDFVTYPGDTLVPGGIGEQLEEFRSRRPAAQAVPGRAGVYFFTDAVHRAVEAVQASARGELEITDVLRWLAGQGLEVVSGTAGGHDEAQFRS
ncbi:MULTISPECIES: sugar phosphate nucleotidyltransferase [unclassified Streptomyces]|uniref:sugar phosphate nucleotidyltransferase n=1 Tax=unclassified Streptomyces TaxID=2593676 RepID=UPI002E10F52F|nr:sugar phosphate nucleotidyltransferase [Streptomyces sp. NBC_01207]